VSWGSQFGGSKSSLVCSPGLDAQKPGKGPGAKEKESKRPVKYPIEDLDLDPMSIHDGRVLRRVLTEVPPLPPKPAPNRQLLVKDDFFERFVMIWNMLNIFA
jgi:bromodomain adjacent to zinc finger domain protein 1A